MVHPIEFAVAVLAEYTTLGAGKAENLEGSFVTILEANPQVTEVRVGYATGEFFAVVQLSGSEGSLRTAAGAPPEAVYATRRIACGAGGAWMMTWSYIGADRKAIGTRSAPVPEPGHQAESWYAAATAAPGTIIQTKASVISGQRAIGMSFARSFTGPSRGVIAAEISLAQLSKVLI
ncbi:MAG: hypothetical protein EXQ84_03070 [Rhodospirillaceae bacterium]|nr:hypothetical protein [Rhodospirillaceae bacterium]